MHIRLRIIVCVALATFARATEGQFIYARTGNNGGAELRTINADGSSDAPLPLPSLKVTAPTWSHDGALLALTATDPARPSLVSVNAWVANLATGATTQITYYRDNAGNGDSIAFTFHKASSPNVAQLAINS